MVQRPLSDPPNCVTTPFLISLSPDYIASFYKREKEKDSTNRNNMNKLTNDNNSPSSFFPTTSLLTPSTSYHHAALPPAYLPVVHLPYSSLPYSAPPATLHAYNQYMRTQQMERERQSWLRMETLQKDVAGLEEDVNQIFELLKANQAKKDTSGSDDDREVSERGTRKLIADVNRVHRRYRDSVSPEREQRNQTIIRLRKEIILERYRNEKRAKMLTTLHGKVDEIKKEVEEKKKSLAREETQTNA